MLFDYRSATRYYKTLPGRKLHPLPTLNVNMIEIDSSTKVVPISDNFIWDKKSICCMQARGAHLSRILCLAIILHSLESQLVRTHQRRLHIG